MSDRIPAQSTNVIENTVSMFQDQPTSIKNKMNDGTIDQVKKNI
jgi:hypothetical protein